MQNAKSPAYVHLRAQYLHMNDEAFEEMLGDDDGTMLEEAERAMMRMEAEGDRAQTEREERAKADAKSNLESLRGQFRVVAPVEPAPGVIGPGRLASAEQIRTYIVAGNAYFTIRNAETGNRFTYRVNVPRNRREGLPPIHFVSVLAGSSNEADYRYIGYIRDGRFVHGGVKSFAKREAPSVIAFGWTWQRVSAPVNSFGIARPLPSSLEVWHEGRCGRCGRKLTVPESVQSGIGPECARRGS